jgi:hypothetical protein
MKTSYLTVIKIIQNSFLFIFIEDLSLVKCELLSGLRYTLSFLENSFYQSISISIADLINKLLMFE